MTRQSEPRGLAELLREHPRALAALEHSLSRQTQAREQAAQASPSAQERACCPHCGAAGVVHAVHGRAYYRWPTTCCPEGICLGAERELRNARNWAAPPEERTDSARRYLNLRGQLAEPSLLTRLDDLDADLGRRAKAGLRAPLIHPQGGN